MATPYTPTRPSLSVSSSSSSFLIRANPTLDSDVESSVSLSSYNGGGDSDFELQGSDGYGGENQFESIPQNPKVNDALVFSGIEGNDGRLPLRASVSTDSDEEHLRSDYSNEEDDEEDVVGTANEVIPIRARLTRESDDDDISTESGERDDEYGFLSAVRMPVRVSSTAAIDFEEEEEDGELEFEPLPPSTAAIDFEEEEDGELEFEPLPPSTAAIDFEDGESEFEPPPPSTAAIDFLEEEDGELEFEPPPPPPEAATMEDVPEKDVNIMFLPEQSISTKESENEDAISFSEVEEVQDLKQEQEHQVSDKEEKEAEEEDASLSSLEPPTIHSSIAEETLISNCSEHPLSISNQRDDDSGKTHFPNPIASENAHDYSENIVEDKEDTPVEKNWVSENERKKLVNFFRFVHRLGLSPEEQWLHQLIKQPNPQSAKEEAKHLEEEERQSGTDSDLSLTILVIGKTGVGKSATINSIFGQERSKVDPYQPGTKSVTAISGTINKVKLTVFDTPGLRPSPSEHSINKKILSSIKRVIRKSPPDLVLYVDRLDQQNQDDSTLLLRLVSNWLGSSIWDSTMAVFTHAAASSSTPAVDYDLRVVLAENSNPVSIESWRTRLLLLGFSMKMQLSEREPVYRPPPPVYRNRFLRLLGNDHTIGEDESLMSLLIMNLKMEVDTRRTNGGGKVLFRIKSMDNNLQIAMLSVFSIANAILRGFY